MFGTILIFFSSNPPRHIGSGRLHEREDGAEAGGTDAKSQFSGKKPPEPRKRDFRHLLDPARRGAPPRQRRTILSVAPRLVLPEGCLSQRVVDPEFAIRCRAAPSLAVSQAYEQVWSASHPPRQPCRASDPAQWGAPPRRRRALRRVVIRVGMSRVRFSQRVSWLEIAARRREAPRGLCSSAIRCRGPRKTETWVASRMKQAVLSGESARMTREQ